MSGNARRATTTAGADSPCSVGVLEAEQSAGPQQPGRDRASAPGWRRGRRRRRTAPRSGRGRGPRAPPRRTRPAGCRAGWRSPGRPAVEHVQGVGHVADVAARRRCRPGSGGRTRRPPARPRRRSHVEQGSSVRQRLGDRPGARCTGPPRPPAGASAATAARSRSIAQPVITSVSGSRHEDAGPDRQRRRGGSGASPVRCCSGTRAARRASRASKRSAWSALTGSSPLEQRIGPARCRRRRPAASRASAAGDATPAPRQSAGRRRPARAPTECVPPCGARSAHDGRRPAASRSAVSASCRASTTGCSSPFSTGVEVVGLEADPVVGDPVLRVVVGADPLRAVDRTHLAPARRRGRAGRPSSSAAAISRARSIRMACSRFCSWERSFWHDTTMPVGRWVIRTAESVVLTPCPPGPGAAVHVDPQIVLVDLDLGLLDLGHDQHAGGGGVHPALGLGHRYALHAVHAALELEHAVRHLVRLAEARAALTATVTDL